MSLKTVTQSQIGLTTESPAAADNTSGDGLNGRLQRIAQNITSLISKLPTALGANGGLKIEGVASGTAVPTSVSSLPLPSGAATSANQSSQSTLFGAVTETAPASDTASSGLNGRLQRIAQRLTSLIGLLPTALSNGNLKVSIQESTLNPAAATTDAISAKLATDKIMDGLTELTPKFAPFGFAASGDNTVIADVTGKKLRVLGMIIFANAAANVYFTSGAAGTVIFSNATNKINLLANQGWTLQFSPIGWMETAAGAALVANSSAASGCSGTVVYVEV
jgi:hypothetical protein